MKPIDNTETLPDEFITDVRSIIENGRKKAYDTIIRTSIKTFCDVGKRIIEEEQKGKTRAKYGTRLIKNLSHVLTPIYGNSYNKRNLEYYRKFYILFPNVEIVNTRVHVLHDSDQIFAAKYMTYMPTEDELRQEIEQQKQFFMEQHITNESD